MIRLVVGLGNPGERYVNTWHNLGARVVKELARRRRLMFKPGRGMYLIAGESGEGAALMIPTSYMNLSGEPVAGWARYFKVAPEEILAVSDDHDIPLGRLRMRENGSSGGHKGLEDMIAKLGSNNFPRLRIGFQGDGEHPELRDQVLAAIPKRLSENVERIVVTAADATEEIIKFGVTVAANRYNGIEIE